MALWKSKNKRLWESTYRTYYPALCRFAFRYLQDAQKAEDVVQSVFLKILEGHAEKADASYFVNYLYRSVRNACINEVNQTSRRDQILQNTPSLNEDESDLFLEIIQSEFYRLLMAEIDELPAQMSHIFKMAYLEEKTNPQIADELQLSIHTVKATKYSAKKKLRLNMKWFMDEDETS